MNEFSPLTAEEASRIFVDYAYSNIGYWLDTNNIPAKKVSGMAFILLSTIDGTNAATPYHRLERQGNNISGKLHDKFNHAVLTDSTEDRFIGEIRNIVKLHTDNMPPEPSRREILSALNHTTYDFLRIIDGSFNNQPGFSLIPEYSDEELEELGYEPYFGEIDISGELAQKFCVVARFVPTRLVDIIAENKFPPPDRGNENRF